MTREIDKTFDVECFHLNEDMRNGGQSPCLKATIFQYEDGGRGISCPRIRENFEGTSDVCLEIFRDRSKRTMEDHAPCPDDHCVLSASYEGSQGER